MQLTHRPPIITSALKALTAAVASAVLVSSAAHAAGLGKLTVLSALGQPLRAEIELTAVSEDEASGLAAKLASPEAFRVANIDFNPALLTLRFAVDHRNGRQYIKISSTQPLNEPFVDMLLELSWNNGKLVREYTFLLDPAELRATQSAQVMPSEAPVARPRAAQQPAVAPEQAAPAVAKAPPAPRPARVAEQPAPAQPRTQAPAAAEYRVKRGDTLGRIASQLKPSDISLDMMLVALYRANPDAFIGNNMNRLKSGQILSVPDADTVRGTGEGEARGVVVAHAADFNAYRNKLAGQVASSAPAKAAPAGQSAAGKITAKVEERPTAANESPDQLRLSKAAPARNALAKGGTATTEDVIAKEKALAEAQARVKELERNVNDLQTLMTVKTRQGSEAVKNATQEAAKPAPAKAAAAKPVPPKVAEAKPTPAKAPAAQPAKKAVQGPPEPSLVDTLMDNITYVGAGAAVLLLAMFGLAQRRRKKDGDDAQAEPSLLGVPTEHTHSLFAETGGQSVDTNNSVFNSSFAPSASQLDTNEVDPVAEADVYIAYGRDAQAEEILKEALRTHPERHPVRLKLLEIYAARKDQRSFETQAAEMYSQTRGQGDEWAQAAALGLSIDPLNPLYAGATAAAPAAAVPTEQELGQQALLSQQLDDTFGAPVQPRAATDDDFSLDHDADNAPTALPDMTAEALDAPAAKAGNTLDFDLAGMSFEPVSTTEPIAMPGPSGSEEHAPNIVPDLEFDVESVAATAPPADDRPAKPAGETSFDDLAFDMNFDAPSAPQAPASDAEDKADDGLALDMSLDGPSSDIDMADLAKEFDMPDLPELPKAQGKMDEMASANELKDPLFDLDAMDFGLPAAAAAPESPVAGSDPEQDPFALPDLPGAPAAAPAAPQFDLSDIDLELPESATRQSDSALPEVEMAGGEGGLSAAHMEMETKLDLAIAYQEIGDKEGARELLDEVIKAGNSEQVSKASAMRDKLA